MSVSENFNKPELDANHVVVETHIGRTSGDLAALFACGDEPLANDTSFPVGRAPGTAAEQFVRTLEPRLHGKLDTVGKDVQLNALGRGSQLHLTIVAAVIDRHLNDLAEHRTVIARIEALAEQHAAESTDSSVSVEVNAADDYDPESVYLTPTGLSAEAGVTPPSAGESSERAHHATPAHESRGDCWKEPGHTRRETV